MLVEQHQIVNRALSVEVIREQGDWVLSLAGELDLANARAVEGALDEALDDGDAVAIVVDLRRLELIDSTGICLFFRAIKRDGPRRRLGFIASESPAVRRVLARTGISRWLPPVRGARRAGLGADEQGPTD